MSDVLNGISHFLGICVGIVILLFVLGFALQTSKPPPPPSKPRKKNSHYHLVYTDNNYNDKHHNNNNNNNKSQNIESYQSSDPFSNSVSNY